VPFPSFSFARAFARTLSSEEFRFGTTNLCKSIQKTHNKDSSKIQGTTQSLTAINSKLKAIVIRIQFILDSNLKDANIRALLNPLELRRTGLSPKYAGLTNSRAGAAQPASQTL
jgi:hypothetical protein